jgi:hypothetical protein
MGLITDLFVDWYKLKGRDTRSSIPNLQSIILNGTYDDMISMIKQYN